MIAVAMRSVATASQEAHTDSDVGPLLRSTDHSRRSYPQIPNQSYNTSSPPEWV